MKKHEYIVECGNWKCLVSLTDIYNILPKEEDKVTEACTQAFEFFFRNIEHDNIEILSIIDDEGEDYFEDPNDEFPKLYLGIITKCYRPKNEKKTKSHYFLLSSALIKNSGLIIMEEPLKMLTNEAYKKNPDLKKFITTQFKNKSIITNV